MSSRIHAIALQSALIASALTVLSPAASAGQAPAMSTWKFPAPLAGDPPAEIWLPHALSDEDRAHRAAVDRALMTADHANGNAIPNAGTLQAELSGEDYGEMETQLDAILAKFLADPSYELVAQSAANFAEEGHVTGTVAPTALIQAWVKARPKSAWAHYSAGLRWSETAWQDRGGGFADSITDEQWKMVHADEAQARAEIRAALKINPKLFIAWVTLMNIDRTDSEGGLAQVTADFNQGSKQVPTSYLIADQYEETLEPRWMGSAGMMDDFAQSQLPNLDRNPRFWELQGDSLADSGCAACNDYHWDVSLKQYNAALAFTDRPTWLAMAGEAALHVHRYALAHAYYERALAYRDDIYWRMFRDFTVELCDPSNTPEQVELYRRDVVNYGGLDNVEYPHGPDDCVVYQRELPWGAEPLAVTAGSEVYAIDSLVHPTFAPEPQPMPLPGPTRTVTSPDGAWVITLVDPDNKGYHLELSGKASDRSTEIYKTTSDMRVGFSSDSKHLYVSEAARGNGGGGCRYIDPSDSSRDADLGEKVIQWYAGQHIVIDRSNSFVLCTQFVNDRILAVMLSGQVDGKQVFQRFNYEMSSGKLVAAQ